jgi:hypothetical protein
VGGGADRELEHEQRRSDRKHAVAEAFEAAGAGSLHGRIVADAQDGELRKELTTLKPRPGARHRDVA